VSSGASLSPFERSDTNLDRLLLQDWRRLGVLR